MDIHLSSEVKCVLADRECREDFLDEGVKDASSVADDQLGTVEQYAQIGHQRKMI